MYKSILFMALLLMVNCATYWGHRKKDLQDIITIGVEKKEYGAGGRVGPLALGFFFQGEKDKLSGNIKGDGFGLRGGNFGKYHTEQLVFGFMGGEKFHIKPKEGEDYENLRNETKKHDIRYFDFFNQPVKVRNQEKKEKYKEKILKKIAHEKKNPEILKLIPKKKQNRYSVSYFFQLEFFFGLYYGIRFGINIFEILDFIVGFAKIDLSKDDKTD